MRCRLPIQVLVLATCLTIHIAAEFESNVHQVYTPEEREKLLKGVESNLLSLFGFSRRPKPDKSKIVIPKEIMELYRLQTGKDLDTVSIPKPGIHAKSANTVRSFTHSESKIDAKFPSSHRFRLFFEINDVPHTDKIQAAEITFTRRALNSSETKQQFQKVLIYDIIRPGIKGKREPLTRLIDSRVVDVRQNDSISLDVLPAVQRWLETPRKNYGLIVQVSKLSDTTDANNHVEHIRLRRSVNTDQDEWLNRQPVLYAYTDDGKSKRRSTEELMRRRSKRATNRKKGTNRPCKKHNLYVDFAEVGWDDWIVAPTGYEAFYCHGECSFPLADHMNATNHAIVQTLVNSLSPNAVPKPCCVPTQLAPISMLYLESNRVVLKNYQEMTVIGCGCR